MRTRRYAVRYACHNGLRALSPYDAVILNDPEILNNYDLGILIAAVRLMVGA
jgi:hypothetical protein